MAVFSQTVYSEWNGLESTWARQGGGDYVQNNRQDFLQVAAGEFYFRGG